MFMEKGAFLKRIFEIGQCKLMVINNDNTNNGCNENNHCVQHPKKLLNYPISHILPYLKKWFLIDWKPKKILLASEVLTFWISKNKFTLLSRLLVENKQNFALLKLKSLFGIPLNFPSKFYFPHI
jgi:hypothetical protein